jgi:hypothetical protein
VIIRSLYFQTELFIPLFTCSVSAFVPCRCVYLSTLLIDTNTTNFTPSQLHTNALDILASHIHANGIEPLILQIGSNVPAHLKSSFIPMIM